MDIERWNGSKERRKFENVTAMLLAAAALAKDPNTKKLTLHFPKLTIPKKRRGKK